MLSDGGCHNLRPCDSGLHPSLAGRARPGRTPRAARAGRCVPGGARRRVRAAARARRERRRSRPRARRRVRRPAVRGGRGHGRRRYLRRGRLPRGRHARRRRRHRRGDRGRAGRHRPGRDAAARAPCAARPADGLLPAGQRLDRRPACAVRARRRPRRGDRLGRPPRQRHAGRVLRGPVGAGRIAARVAALAVLGRRRRDGRRTGAGDDAQRAAAGRHRPRRVPGAVPRRGAARGRALRTRPGADRVRRRRAPPRPAGQPGARGPHVSAPW